MKLLKKIQVLSERPSIQQSKIFYLFVSLFHSDLFFSSKLRLYFEEIIMTGEKQLRIDCDENYASLFATTKGSSTTSSFFSALGELNANQFLSSITGIPDKQSTEMKAMKTLIKLRERNSFYTKELEPYYKQNQPENESYHWIPLESPKKPEKVYGDQLLTWLLLRGLIMIELNRVGEAIIMFKLMECYKVRYLQIFFIFLLLTSLIHRKLLRERNSQCL
jgi:hypothetical protein